MQGFYIPMTGCLRGGWGIWASSCSVHPGFLYTSLAKEGSQEVGCATHFLAMRRKNWDISSGNSLWLICVPRQFLSDTLGSGQRHNIPVVPFRVCELTSMTRASASCQKVSYVAGSSSNLVAVTLFCLHFYFLLCRTSPAGRLLSSSYCRLAVASFSCCT